MYVRRKRYVRKRYGTGYKRSKSYGSNRKPRRRLYRR